MLNEAIETLLEKRFWEAVHTCEESNKKVFYQFEEIIQSLKSQLAPELEEGFNLLEDLFLQNQTSLIKQAHRIGFEDCIQLRKELRSLI